MDPLAAFSLASSVIQVVDFSMKIVVQCRALYKDGAPSEYKDIESTTRHLTNLKRDLELPGTIQSAGSAPQLYHDDQDLLKLAEQCSGTATELIDELKKLSIQGRHRKWDALFKAVKGALKHSAIENIQKKLEQYRRTLDSRILINLRQHVQMNASEQSDGFRDLDRKIQLLVIGVSKDQNTFDELKKLIKAENASSKQHIGQELQRHREMIATEEYYKRILESLYFPDIHARQEGIDEAHKKTFEWIFDKPGYEPRRWHHFIDWLENGHGTYWISGKAGSGKSTLMSFICHDSRTDEALRTWSGTNEVFKPSFFFWNPGSPLQKSLAGLLRSLIYQIVEEIPGLMPVLAKCMGPSQHGFHQLPTWTEQRLRATLQTLLSVGLEQYRMCIFIDGLDEFHGNHATLLDLIRTLRRSTRVKFCLASRPYRSFKDELGSSPMLRLHDLTELDIRRYVSDKLEGVSLKASPIPYSSSTIKDTIDTIVWKAEGVFLWVNLAVRDQLEGIRNGDDAEQLRERLEILPTEIEEVYGHMLQGVEKVYRKEVARYICSALNERGSSFLQFALAQHKRIDDIVLLSPDISVSDICQHCKSIRERVVTTCKGFLEVREEVDLGEWQRRVTAPSSHYPSSLKTYVESLKDREIPLKEREELTEMKFFHACTRVEFLHRTAFDFFKNNEQGKEFLKVYTSEIPDPLVLDVKAWLAALVVFPVLADDFQVRASIYYIMLRASTGEDETRVAQPDLVDLIDRSITMLCERSRGQPPDISWCRVWSPLIHDSRGKIPYPMDFLGSAAWFGLHEYVEKSLSSQSGQPTADTTDYLLRCSLHGLRSIPGDSLGRLKLIQMFLKRGADPNLEYFDGTVWGRFLERLSERCSWRDCDWEDSTNNSSVLVDELWSDVVRTFLESGANVNENCPVFLDTYIRIGIDSVNSPPMVLTSYSVRLHLSARSALQQCFARNPCFVEIEDRLITSGATLYSECTHIFLHVNDGKKYRCIDSKLSKQQLNHFTDTYEKILNARLNQVKDTSYTNPSKKSSSERFEIVDRQAVELFQELDIEQLYLPALQDEGLEIEASQEEDPQEYQSSIDNNRASEEPSTDAADSPTCEAEEHAHSSRSSQEEDCSLQTENAR